MFIRFILSLVIVKLLYSHHGWSTLRLHMRLCICKKHGSNPSELKNWLANHQCYSHNDSSLWLKITVRPYIDMILSYPECSIFMQIFDTSFAYSIANARIFQVIKWTFESELSNSKESSYGKFLQCLRLLVRWKKYKHNLKVWFGLQDFRINDNKKQ